MKNYDHKKIEKKWQKEWEAKKVYKTESNSKKKPYYVLDMFPYPSGQGLHVGHPRGYIGSDVFARLKRMQGYNVLHPMGFDAFGLPAEQYAIQTGKHPSIITNQAIKTYKKQLEIIGFSYDWSREVQTIDPHYYKWTQYIFLQIYNSFFDIKKQKARHIDELVKIFEKEGNAKVNDIVAHSEVINFSKKEWANFSPKEKQDILMKYRLAYEGYAEVNWCKDLGTVLANDEVVEKNGKLFSERGDFPVEKKNMRQWFMRISAYGDRLISGLEHVDFASSTKETQINWIGKSEGSEIEFKTTINRNIKIFTTRADTILGATYLVISPEHSNIGEFLVQSKNMAEVSEYICETTKNKNSPSREAMAEHVKTGVELKGIKAINPANNDELPIWVGDYVLASYGTGAIMAVPMHDERDREFAEKYNIPIIDRPLVDLKEITKQVGGTLVTKYKMRDAIFARQRYWGEPIPLIHDKKTGLIKEVPLSKLPLKLPNVKSYKPTGTGESPLASVGQWVKAGYETNTMPGWAASSWYFLRYMDPKNNKELASKKAINYWTNVDMYVGGTEHNTGHLLYSRFWHKFLYDIGIAKTEEPFKALRHQGMIGGADGRKMSKRWGNVVNPDDVVATYGADSLRLFEMFLGPFNSHLPWSQDNIIGPRRFIERVYKIGTNTFAKNSSKEIEKALHKTIKKVGEDIVNFEFNTAVSSMMIFTNEVEKHKSISINDFKKFLQILAPFAPHVSEELWYSLGEKKSIHLSSWPKYEKKKIVDDEITIAVQINGKVRTEIKVSIDITEEVLKNMVLNNEVIKSWVKDNTIKRFVYVKGRLINIVL